MKQPTLSGVVASAATALFLLGAAQSAMAASFDEPEDWAVGDPNTTYQQWDAVSPSNPINANPTHVSSPALSAPTLSATGAFIASSGGYYSFSGNYNVNANIANYGGTGPGTWVNVQTGATLNPDLTYPGSSEGASILRDSFKIRDGSGNLLASSSVGDVTRTFYSNAYESSFGTVQYEELLWSVYLPGYTGNISVSFDNIVHSSLAAVRVDTAIAPVPEPGTYALLMAGMGAVGFVARRRRRQS